MRSSNGHTQHPRQDSSLLGNRKDEDRRVDYNDDYNKVDNDEADTQALSPLRGLREEPKVGSTRCGSVGERWRNAVFTAWDMNHEPKFDGDTMQYLIYQREVAPSTGKHHWQGYVEFKKQVYFGYIQKWIGQITRVAPAKGTAEQNLKYCSKSKTSVPNTFKSYGSPKGTMKKIPVGDANFLNSIKLYTSRLEDAALEYQEYLNTGEHTPSCYYDNRCICGCFNYTMQKWNHLDDLLSQGYTTQYNTCVAEDDLTRRIREFHDEMFKV